MTLFNRKRPRPEYRDPAVARYFTMTRMIIDLTPTQYDKFKNAMDEAFESFQKVKSFKTNSEKIDQADYILSKEPIWSEQ